MRNIQKYNGRGAEKAFERWMSQFSINCVFVDSWFDFQIGFQEVEVKSARLSVKTKARHRTGVFDFRGDSGTRTERTRNYDLLKMNNIWIAFYLRIKKKYYLIGFMKSKYIDKPVMSIHRIVNHPNLISAPKWLSHIRRSIG